LGAEYDEHGSRDAAEAAFDTALRANAVEILKV
jgi:hypothetical protein